jgi:hypothetical protein
MIRASVIVRDFDFVSVMVMPGKTDSVLIVYADTKLPFTISAQFFQAISGRILEVGKIDGSV